MLEFLTPLFPFLYTGGPYWWATWQGKWAVLLFALAASISLQAAKKFHWSVAPALAVTLGSAIYAGAWSFMSHEAAYSALCLALLYLFFMPLTRRNRPAVELSLAVISLISIGWLPIWKGGLIGNPSMNGCLIAITLPFVNLPVVYPVGLVGLVYIGQSIPLGVAAVMFAAYLIASGTRLRARHFVVAMAVGLASYAYQYPMLFHSNERFASWEKVLAFWWSTNQHWFGLGTGSGPVVFRQAEGALSLFAHNDYLQMLFENGIVGLVSAVILLVGALVRSFNRPLLFASVCGYAATAFFNYPAHLPVHAFVGAALLWITHVKR